MATNKAYLRRKLRAAVVGFRQCAVIRTFFWAVVAGGAVLLGSAAKTAADGNALEAEGIVITLLGGEQ